MCGIAGVYFYDFNRKADAQLIGRMNHVLKHRGPDDSGVWTFNHVGLGHVRLSILDLSNQGHQPMTNEDETVWITFNGEIYNFLALREDLEKKGHQFRSRTDTEVVIHLWEEYGSECLAKLAGMFAFAIFDKRTNSVFLARDRFGKKPLFYADTEDRFLFGSEIKAILQDPQFLPEPDLKAIHYYLSFQSVPSPFSAFKGIKKLPPGHFLHVRFGKEKPRSFWELSYQKQFKVLSVPEEDDLEKEIISRLSLAVKDRLMSDVPLGAFLSGGIDSSIVVALMAQASGKPVKTFSIGFKEDEYNELPYARMVAERYKTEHHEFVVTPDARAIFPELIWHYNEPFADSSAIPTFYVSKLAKKFVSVVLSGDAGDENFAGYSRYEHSTKDLKDFGKGFFLKNLFQRFSNLTSFWDRTGFNRHSLKRLVNLSPGILDYYFRITHFHEGYQKDLYSDDFKSFIGESYSYDFFLSKFKKSDGITFLDKLLDLDLGFYLPDTLMTKTDVASMAHSLEVRTPMLDHKFVEFVAKIPSRLKLKDGKIGKHILKKAVEPFLPAEVIYRKKMGFGVPLDHWLRGELKDFAYEILLSSAAEGRGYFRKNYVLSLLDRHQKGENWQYLIWNLLMLELWHLMFIDQTLQKPQ